MTYPKLSALLNNCPLHAITPELKAEVIKFQTIDQYDNGHYDDYALLKNIFATFYGLDPNAFTWDKFANILKNYNEFDIQIIMGPVLREFMKDKMRDDEFVKMVAGANEISVEQHIRNMTELKARTGRYESLSPDEVFSYVAKHLGFSIQYFRNDKGEISKAPHSITTIQMYHQGGLEGAQAGGHWERSNHGEESIDFEQKESTQLTSFLPLLGNDKDINPYGFALLKMHVKTSAQVTEENDLKPEFYKLAFSAEQIYFYIKALTVLPKELAVPLLGEYLTDETENFVRRYIPILEIREPIYEQWFRARPESKPGLLLKEEEVIRELLTPPKWIAPVVQSPIIKPHVIEQPIIEAPIIEPIVFQPIKQDPVIEPVIIQPKKKEPVITQPKKQDPVIEPVITQPKKQDPVIEPVITQPKKKDPVIKPAIIQPKEQDPIIAPEVIHDTIEEPEQDFVANQIEIVANAIESIKSIATNGVNSDLIRDNKRQKAALLRQIKTFTEQEEIKHAITILKDQNNPLIRDFGNVIIKANIYIEQQSKAQHVQKILDAFEKQIKNIGEHHKEAHEEALKLHTQLQTLKNELFKESTFETPIATAQLGLFAQQTKAAITAATPILQKDLGWGDYLANMVKSIVNAVTKAISFGNHPGFFTIKESSSVTRAKELEQDIDKSLSLKS